VVPRKKRTRKLPRRGRRSGKGERIIIWKPLHIIERIPSTIVIIVILMGKMRKSVVNYIQCWTRRTVRRMQRKRIF